MRHGKGVLTLANGETWSAEFKNDEIVASNVKITYEDGSVYEGQFKDGLAHGTGKI